MKQSEDEGKQKSAEEGKRKKKQNAQDAELWKPLRTRAAPQATVVVSVDLLPLVQVHVHLLLVPEVPVHLSVAVIDKRRLIGITQLNYFQVFVLNPQIF